MSSTGHGGVEYIENTVAGVWAEMPDPTRERGPYLFLRLSCEISEDGTEYSIEMDAADRITDVQAAQTPPDDFDSEAEGAVSVNTRGVSVDVRHQGPMPLEVGVLAAGSTFLGDSLGIEWNPPSIKEDSTRSRINLPVTYAVAALEIGDTEQRHTSYEFVAAIARMAYAEKRRRQAREEAVSG